MRRAGKWFTRAHAATEDVSRGTGEADVREPGSSEATSDQRAGSPDRALPAESVTRDDVTQEPSLGVTPPADHAAGDMSPLGRDVQADAPRGDAAGGDVAQGRSVGGTLPLDRAVGGESSLDRAVGDESPLNRDMRDDAPQGDGSLDRAMAEDGGATERGLDTARDAAAQDRSPQVIASLDRAAPPGTMRTRRSREREGSEGHDEARRDALVDSLPMVDDSTPLAAQLHLDAQRRIRLTGKKFPRPSQTRIITIANQKGGVGKTTTTVNLAAALAQAGLVVLVLDNDPQGNASTALGIEHRSGTPSIYEVLVDGAPMVDAVQECPEIPQLLCVPATIDLSGAEIELVSMVARETRLRNALDAYLKHRSDTGQERIDYVLVDCPPSLGLLTVNAFVVGREVLIPIQCEYYALEGLSQLLKTIQLIQAHLNPGLHVSTILLTMFDSRTNLAQQVAAEVREHFPEVTLRTNVPRSVRISEAPSYGQTVMTYDPGSSGALAYLEAAREVADRGLERRTDERDALSAYARAVGDAMPPVGPATVAALALQHSAPSAVDIGVTQEDQ
jgi:chromosome partitioning protein